MASVNTERKFATSVKEMDVYQKAYQASLQVQHITKNFPGDERFSLTDQMRRCSRSICANLAEGFIKQRHSAAEFKRYVSIAAGSSCEMSVWIDYCRDFGYIDLTLHKTLEAEYLSISRMLNKLHTSLVKR